MTAPGSMGRRLGRFASFNVAQHLWLAAVSLLATPILYHRLGEAAYGLLSVVTVVVTQLSVLELGFGHATIRALGQGLASGDGRSLERTVGTALWVFTAAALTGAGVLLVGAGPLAERYFHLPPDLLAEGRLALRIAAALFAASILGTLASAVWQGLQRFGFLNLVSGVASTLQLLGSLVLVLSGFGVLAVLGWSVALAVLTLAVHARHLRRLHPGVRLPGRPHGETFRAMLSFGSLLTVAGLFTQVFLSGGGLVLGHFVAVGVLPFYTVPFGIYQRLGRVGAGFASALYPLVAELDGLRDRKTLDRVFVSGSRIMLLAGLSSMAPAVLVASPFLSAWMGAEFAAAGGRVLEMFFAAFALAMLATPAMELARGTGRAGWLVTCSAVLAVVNVLGAALAAPRWGAAGAAAAFLAAQAAGTAYILARVGGRACGGLATPGVLVVAAVAAGGALWGLEATSDPWLRLGMAAALGPALVGLGLGALSREERAALRRMAGRP